LKSLSQNIFTARKTIKQQQPRKKETDHMNFVKDFVGGVGDNLGLCWGGWSKSDEYFTSSTSGRWTDLPNWTARQ